MNLLEVEVNEQQDEQQRKGKVEERLNFFIYPIQ